MTREICLVAVLASSAALAGPLPKGLWRKLLAPGASWKLDRSNALGSDDTRPEQVTITAKDVRKIGKASIVRLTWSCGDEDCRLHGLPEQIAVRGDEIFFFAGDADDAAIGKQLKKSPTFHDPQSPARPYTRHDGLFAFAPPKHAGAACFGINAEKVSDGVGCGAAPCNEWLCLDPTGVIAVGGLGEGENYGAPIDGTE
jgi:hypothetical protein